MIRLAAATAAVVLFVAPLLTAPIQVVAVPGVIGLLLAAVGIASLWRWPLTAAACVFATDYALWLAGASMSIVSAAGFGLARLFLLQWAEVARCARAATVDAGALGAVLAVAAALIGAARRG